MKQATFALIKSGALSRGAAPAIVSRIYGAGLGVVALFVDSQGHGGPAIGKHRFEALYQEHLGRPYYDGLIASVISPLVAVPLVIVGDDAISAWRVLMGATDPSKASVGTIRADFGVGLPDNATHGSDSEESASREINLFFPNLEPLHSLAVMEERAISALLHDVSLAEGCGSKSSNLVF